jgi:lysophospholipase L1-like esterase
MLLAVVAFVVSVAALEIGARIVVDSRSIESLRTYDASGIPVHTRNFSGTAWDDESGRRVHLQTNNLGFMGPISLARKDSRTFRIAILGDSFTEAFQVDANKSFSSLVQTRLAELDKSVEVWNFGYSGTGPVEALTIYHEYVRRLTPDLVVLAFFFNDFVDANVHNGIRSVIEKGDIATLTSAIARSKRTGWRYALTTRSRLFEFVLLRAHRSPRSRSILQRLGLASPIRGHSNPNALPDHLAQFERDSPLADQYDMWLLAFDRLARDVHQEGSGFLTVLLPLKAQVYTESFLEELAAERPATRLPTLDFDRVDRFLVAEFRKRKAMFLHLLPAFRVRSGEKELYFRGHFTEAGHALTARLLVDHIVESYF